MSCSQCYQKFTMFNREKTCQNCGFIICSKCLGYKANLPNSKKAANVCYNCYENIVNPKSKEEGASVEPPANFVKRLEALNKRNNLPPPNKKQVKKVDQPAYSTAPTAAPSTTGTTEQQIIQRLAALRAARFATYGPLPTLEEIEERLRKLRDDDLANCSSNSLTGEHLTEEDLANNLISQYMNEIRIASKSPDTPEPRSERLSSDEKDDLPWCCICNEDAKLQCPDCDDDLYCQRCFRKCHKKFELKDHHATPFNPPKTKT